MSQLPPPPRRLTRSTSDRFLGGVCGGLAQYLNMDAALVRLLAVVVTLVAGGAPLLVYVLAWFLVPEDGRTTPPPPPGLRPPYHPPAQRPAPPAGPGDPIWGREGAPWEQPQPYPQGAHDPGPDAPRDRT